MKMDDEWILLVGVIGAIGGVIYFAGYLADHCGWIGWGVFLTMTVTPIVWLAWGKLKEAKTQLEKEGVYIILAPVLAVLVIGGTLIANDYLEHKDEPARILSVWVGMDTNPSLDGKNITEIYGVIRFRWNNRYTHPRNVSAKMIINEDLAHRCFVYGAYTAECQLRTVRKVNSIRLVFIADGVILINEMVWECDKND